MLHARIQIAANGRIVIPAEMRCELGIQPGDQIVLSVHGKELRMTTLRERIAQAQAKVRKYFPTGTRMSERLIEDRREEVRRKQGGA
jgi:AbrB family looped-hinge helix DNA binding protein